MKACDAIWLALLIVVVAAVLAWFQMQVERTNFTPRPASSDDRLRKSAEQSGFFPTYGEDDQ